MIDRVHCDTTNCRAYASPALGAGFAELAQVVFAVTYFTDRRTTIDVNLAHFAGTQANRRVCTFASRQLGSIRPPNVRVVRPCRASSRCCEPAYRPECSSSGNALPGLIGASSPLDDWRALFDALRRENVATLTIRKLDQRNVCAAVRVVLEPFDNAGHTVFVALEVDNPVTLLVPAAVVTNRDPAVVVAATTTWSSCRASASCGLPLCRSGVRTATWNLPSCGRRF